MGDAQSPTQMVYADLQTRGLPNNADNVRRVLTQNSNQPGSIPGLVNEAPDAADSPTPAGRPHPPTAQAKSSSKAPNNSGSNQPPAMRISQRIDDGGEGYKEASRKLMGK